MVASLRRQRMVPAFAVVLALIACGRAGSEDSTAGPARNRVLQAFDGDGTLSDFGLQRQPFLNAGGGKAYSVEGGVLSMNWEADHNRGDVLFPLAGKVAVLSRPGASIQVDVRVTKRGQDFGNRAGLYRSGPGLYLTDDPTQEVGRPGHHSVSLLIGNTTNDDKDMRRVLALPSLGGFALGEPLSSANSVWTVGQWVTLRATYVGETKGEHAYRFSFKVAEKFETLGTIESARKLRFAGIQFHASLFDGTTDSVSFPVRDFMQADNLRLTGADPFKLAKVPSRPAAPPSPKSTGAGAGDFWKTLPRVSYVRRPMTLLQETPKGEAPSPLAIVCPPNSRVARFAARELQKYLLAISGQRPIIDSGSEPTRREILLLPFSGRPKNSILADEFKPGGEDAFRIRTADGRVVIAGGTDRGVLFGVYDLLERLGCRWFGPMEEYVPTRKSVVVPPLDVHEKPALRWRGLEYIAGCDPACIDWMTKLRLNVAWPEKYVPNKDMSASSSQMEATAVPAMIDRGLSIFWGGHILPQLMSPETYADHPEYFARIKKAERLDPAVDYSSRTQLCTSNERGMRQLTENVIRFLEAHPWIDVLFVWAGDTSDWCSCGPCRAIESDPDRPSNFGGLDRSASYCRMIKIINEGSLPGMRIKFDGVQQALPGRRVAFNHYYNLEDLPRDRKGQVRTDVLPERNVLSAVDAYRQCDRHAFVDEDCPKGKRIRPIAKMWAPYYPESVSWSYYWSWNFMKGLPVSMVHKIPRDFQFVRSLGINGVIDNVSLVPSTLHHFDTRPDLFVTDHWRYNVMNFYIYAKAAWNPDLDVDTTVADFIQHYYGPAAPRMAQFWALMEKSWVEFGRTEAFQPEHDVLAKSATIHSWVFNIRHIIPNRAIFDRLSEHLREARYLAASHYDQPLKPKYMPYLERVQLLERALAPWPSTKPDARPLHK